MFKTFKLQAQLTTTSLPFVQEYEVRALSAAMAKSKVEYQIDLQYGPLTLQNAEVSFVS